MPRPQGVPGFPRPSVVQCGEGQGRKASGFRFAAVGVVLITLSSAS